MRKYFKDLDWKVMLSLAALFTSVSALYVSYRQLDIAVRSQTASVMPYLTYAYRTNTELLEMYIRNDGTGPAFISRVEVVIGDSTYSNFWEPVITFLDTSQIKKRVTISKNDLLPGWVLRPNDDYWPFFTIEGIKNEDLNKFWQFFKFKAKIWYMDIYGNCFLMDTEKEQKIIKANCPVNVLKLE